MKNGWIALDIDGTITLDKYSVPLEVISYLKQLNSKGWSIAFATGRPLSFASMALSQLDFPYVLLSQNGSAAFEMPEKKILFKRYISPAVLDSVEKIYQGLPSDFLIYAGYEKGDFCYWRPNRFSEEDLHYLEDLQKRQKEKWRALKDFKESELDDFPLIKCFGLSDWMRKVAHKLEATAHFQVARIKDPFVENFELLLVTDKGVSKGLSLTELFKLKGRGARVIAAGDDENDISLLQIADVKIAMSHAPESLASKADFIAPPTKDLGIIQALEMALRNG